MKRPGVVAMAISVALVAGGLATAARAGAGDVIPVPTDKTSIYMTLEQTSKPNGVVEVITERSGEKGHFYTVRDCDCPVSKYRILGQGKTMDEARQRYPSDGLMELVKGSVSYDICTHACMSKP